MFMRRLGTGSFVLKFNMARIIELTEISQLAHHQKRAELRLLGGFVTYLREIET